MITAYKGMEGNWESGDYNRFAWFTNDKDYAGNFGGVKEFQISPYNMIKMDAKTISLNSIEKYYDDKDDALDAIEAIERGGYNADFAIYDLMERAKADCIAIENWEGAGLCYVAKCYVASQVD